MEQANQTGGNPLGTEKVGKLIIRFSIPAIISMVVAALYNIVDQIFIGQIIGLPGIAATNVAFPLTTIGTALALLIGVGGASNFNLYLGRKEPDRASYIAGNSIMLLVLSGAALGLLTLLFLRPLLLAFGATQEVLPYAEEYTRIVAVGLPFMVFTIGASHLIRADGSPTYSMLCQVAGAVFNVIFDAVFMNVFKMGMAGAALATTLGQILTSCLALFYLLRKVKTVPLRRKHYLLKASCFRQISLLGMAAFFNQLAMTVVQIALNNVLRYYGALSVYGSEIPLASVGAISKVNMVFMSLAIGIAQGCQPINGYNYGAGQYGRVKQTCRMAITAATVISVIAFLIFQFFPYQIVSIFGEGGDQYIKFSVKYLRIYMFATFVNGIQPVASNFFTSIGKAKLGIFMSLTRQVIFLLPLVLFLPVFLGIDGVMYAGPVADMAAAILAGTLIFRELKQMGGHSLRFAEDRL